MGAGRMLALPGSLSPERLPALLDARFATPLLDALRGAAAAPDRADADAFLPARAGDEARGEAAPAPHAVRPLDAWFGLLAAFLSVVERVLATRAAQRGAP
jgi:hypothetical protein